MAVEASVVGEVVCVVAVVVEVTSTRGADAGGYCDVDGARPRELMELILGWAIWEVWDVADAALNWDCSEFCWSS